MFTVNRKVVMILIALPIVYTMIFGGLFYRNSLTDVPIIVCNLDDGAAGRRLVRDLFDTPELHVIDVDGDVIDIERRMISMNAFGAVIIPNDFSQHLNVGGATIVEVLIDNTNRALGGTVSKAVQSVVATINAEVVAKQLASSAGISMSSRILFNPTTGYEDFFLAALIVHSVQIAIVFSIAPSIVEEKLSVTKPTKFLISRFITYSTIEIATLAICLSIAFGVFGIKCAGNPTEMLLLTSAFVACVTAFALMVGAWLNDTIKALLSPLVYIMPSILFAGVTWPRTSMDDFSLFLSYIMPIGFAAEDLRSMLVKGVAVDWISHTFTLLVIGGIFFAIALIGLMKNVGDRETRTETARA